MGVYVGSIVGVYIGSIVGAYVGSIVTYSTWDNIRALQTEWLIKHPARKWKVLKCFKGAKGRINSLVEIFEGIPEEEKVEMHIHPDN